MPSTVEWANKLSYIHTMKYNRPMKRNKMQLYATTRMSFKNGILSESSQTQKNTFHMIPFM